MSDLARLAAQSREGLDKWASVYWAARAPHVLRRLRLRPGQRVLDLGCNSGLWSRTLAAAGATVVGVDIDMKALRIAAGRATTAATRPTYLKATAESLPFADGVMDGIICIDVLDGVPDTRAALREMRRVLKPGGRLVITGISRTRRPYFVPMSFDGYGERHSQADLRALLRGAGFRIGAEFSFYQTFGRFARGAGQLAHQSGLGRVPGLNLGIGLTLAGLVRLDRLMPRRPDDTGMGFVGVKDD